MPKIGDIEFEMDDLTDKGKMMAQDYLYSRRRLAELQGEVRMMGLAQVEILNQLKGEFTKNNPFE
ncbi:MAG: hypothetical protein FJ077_15860 [Cyanobacteria bacterium K_DeepCast_35m_m2_023]|nr:hypothetical protein [Cyanobacteria bacterium K_DeepCast_35m_m2_023]